MIVPGSIEAFKKYLAQNDTRWAFGNSILYKMCNDYPLHNDKDIIVAKIWLIGRSYAAAIERRRSHLDYKGDDYYYEMVAPKMLSIGSELDDRLSELNNSRSIYDNLEKVLSTHKFLMDAFFELTGLEKRSLAAKYLHFHCPSKFFIYDSIAREEIHKFVKKPKIKILQGLSEYDNEYADFGCRLLELQQELLIYDGVCYSPRVLDGFLLRRIDI